MATLRQMRSMLHTNSTRAIGSTTFLSHEPSAASPGPAAPPAAAEAAAVVTDRLCCCCHCCCGCDCIALCCPCKAWHLNLSCWCCCEYAVLRLHNDLGCLGLWTRKLNRRWWHLHAELVPEAVAAAAVAEALTRAGAMTGSIQTTSA
jgi:hypothetical protein